MSMTMLGRTISLCFSVLVSLGAVACGVAGVGTDPGKNGKPAALRVAWHVNTQANAGSFFLGTPAVMDGVVFLEDGNTVLALDAATGEKRWARPVRVAPIAPARAVLASKGFVYVSEVDSVLCMRASDGSTVWNFHPDSQAVGVFPSLDDRAFYTGQRGIPIVYALDITTGRLLWKTNIGVGWGYPGHVTGTAVSGDTVYVAARRYLTQNGYKDHGTLVALDRMDGHELWRYEETDDFTGLEDAPVVSGQYLVVSDLIGNSVFAFDRFALREVWRLPRSTNGPDALPIVSGGDVYIGSEDTFAYRVDLATGAIRWKQGAGGSIGGIALCDGHVFLQAFMIQRHDMAQGAYTGYLNYVPERGPFTSNIATDGKKIYFAGEDGVYGVWCT